MCRRPAETTTAPTRWMRVPAIPRGWWRWVAARTRVAGLGPRPRSQHFRRPRIAPQHRQLQTVMPRPFNRALHRRVVGVALGVNEEVVLPIHLFARAFLDIRQVDAAFL